jgi:hypothetical protein
MTTHVDASSGLGWRATGLLLALSVAGIVSLAALGCEESRAPAKTPTTSGASAKETQSTPESSDKTSTVGAPEVSPAATGAATSSSEVKTEQGAAAPVAAPAVEDSSTRNISFDRIKFELKANADYKPEMLTPEIKALDGKNVRIRGFMFPSFKPTGLTEWVLVRDNMQCCFGGNAILYDCIIVDMKPGKSTDYTTRIVSVEGKFTIRDWFDLDGVRRAIYHLDGEAVRF